MDGIVVGNAADEGQEGWFIGHFVEGEALRRTPDVEVKWGVHSRGENKGGFTANRTARTMSVLVGGRRFRLRFPDGESPREVMLDKPGDYALWDAGIAHDWFAERDCVILTVRWPSVPDDQVMEQRGW